MSPDCYLSLGRSRSVRCCRIRRIGIVWVHLFCAHLGKIERILACTEEHCGSVLTFGGIERIRFYFLKTDLI